jgi:lysyl oxidase
MSPPPRPALLIVLLLAALAAPGAAAAAKRDHNPCLVPAERAKLRCPDLKMSKPFGLRLDPFVYPGHVVLRAGNSINSVGKGPAELYGVRTSRFYMRGRQRIHRRSGRRLGRRTGARLYFKFAHANKRYWKFLYAAKFELFRLDSRGRRVRKVRRGPKVSYCLRDLMHTHGGLPRSPHRRVYPACNTHATTKKVKLGTSVGWSDVYPPTYPEQWIDVTGLRGCFAYVHTADPRNGIYESNERNNSAYVTVRLPFKPGPQHCAGVSAASLPTKADDRRAEEAEEEFREYEAYP